MPQTRYSTSALGARIAPKISKFLYDNAQFAQSLKDGSVEDGAEAISNAVSYGIALALSGPEIQSALSVGIAPPPVPPSAVTAGMPTMGQIMFNTLKPTVTEST